MIENSYLLLEALTGFIYAILYRHFFESRYSEKTVNIVLVLFSLVCTALYLFTSGVMNLGYLYSGIFSFSLTGALTFLVLTKDRDIRFVIAFYTEDLLCFIIIFISRISGLLFGSITGAISLIILIIAAYFITKKLSCEFRAYMAALKFGWRLIVLQLMMFYIMLHILCMLTYSKKEQLRGIVLIVILIMIIGNSYYLVIKSITQSKQAQMAFIDGLTQINNRTAYIEKIKKLEKTRRTIKNIKSVCCISMDINGLKEINDNLGHLAGDDIIKNFSEILIETIGLSMDCYRTGGDEFTAIGVNISEEKVVKDINSMFETIEELNESRRLPFEISAAVGYAFTDFKTGESIESTFVRADKKMYEEKNKMHEKKKSVIN